MTNRRNAFWGIVFGCLFHLLLWLGIGYLLTAVLEKEAVEGIIYGILATVLGMLILATVLVPMVVLLAMANGVWVSEYKLTMTLIMALLIPLGFLYLGRSLRDALIPALTS